MTSNHSSGNRHLIGVLYKPFCKILILVGVATLMLSVTVIWQYQQMTKRKNGYTASVTDVIKINTAGADERGQAVQKCHIHYTFNWNRVQYTDVLGYRGNPTTEKCAMKAGQIIGINFDQNHPSNNAYKLDDAESSHDTFSKTASSAISIAVVGLIPLIVGILGLHSTKRAHEVGSDSAN